VPTTLRAANYLLRLRFPKRGGHVGDFFAEGFALADAVAIVADGFVFVVQIETQHLPSVFRRFYLLWSDRRHFAQVIDLTGERERVLQFLSGVQLQLVRDAHVLGAYEHCEYTTWAMMA
jgi:hypothetical protein